MADIHETALIDSGAKIADNVEIGPYSIIGPNVEIAAGTKLHSHVIIDGYTEIGPNCEVFSFAALGTAPQDSTFQGEPSRLVIGARNVIREYVTMSPGTKRGLMETKVGDDCMFLIGSHVGHDCVVGNHVVLTNNSPLAGHVELGDNVIIGGLAAVQQRVRVGRCAFLGGLSPVTADVIPFGMALGNRTYLGGLNIVGLRRQGFSREEINKLRRAYRLLFADEGTMSERVDDVADSFPDEVLVQEIVSFIRANNGRPLTLPRAARGG